MPDITGPGLHLNEQLKLTTEQLSSFRSKSEFTDVVICADDEELFCHKAVLAASSPYFYAMFSSPYKEQRNSYVRLDHCSPWALHCLLDFAYTGVLDLSVTTVQDVFTTSTLLDYPIAAGACARFMEQHLDLTNCLGVEQLADQHGLNGLSKAARKLAVNNFANLVVQSSEWITLPLQSVVSYITCDDLDVPSEKCIWDACMSWIDHDPESRLQHLPTLLSHIRLRQLSSEFIATQLQENTFIQESKTAQKFIRYAVHDSSSELSEHSHNHIEQPPRPATLKKPTLVVLGGLNSYILNCMQSFSPSKSTWMPCPTMPVDGLAWFSAVVASNCLFVIGGINAGTIVATVYVYSPARGHWSQCCSMPQPRARHTAVAVDNSHIFVFGGLTVTSAENDHGSNLGMSGDHLQNSALITGVASPTEYENSSTPPPTLIMVSSIVRYDLASDEWTCVGQANQPRLESHTVLVNSVGLRGGLDWIDPRRSALHQTVHLDNGQRDSDFLNDDCGFDHAHTEDKCAHENCRGRQPSGVQTHIDDRTIIELGGVTVSQPHGTDQITFYSLSSDLSIVSTGAYIKLPQLTRYVSCAIHHPTNLVYLFWEQTSALSVLDLSRNTLRSLSPLHLKRADETRVHAGVTWVGNRLYVVGGFSELSADDHRPTAPRSEVHCYDPEKDIWSYVHVSNTTVPRAIFGCVCLNM